MKRRTSNTSPTASQGQTPVPIATPLTHKSKKQKMSSPTVAHFLGVPGVGNAFTSANFSVLEAQERTTSVAVPVSTDDGEEWTKVERRKAKKARKVDARLENSPPRFFYVNSEIVKRREAVTISDIRDLVLHLLGDASPQPWLKVENRNAIAKVVTLFVPGILPEHIDLPPLPTSATANPNIPLAIPLPRGAATPTGTGATDVNGSTGTEKPERGVALPFVARTFSHACPTRAPGEATRMHSVMSAFFQVPMNLEQRKRRDGAAALAAALASGAKRDELDAEIDPSRFLLTPAQMRMNEYPTPRSADGTDDSVLEEGWVEIPLQEGEGRAKAYAVDCEMCVTEDGKELTRICVVDYYSEEVVLDRLVKPAKPITDYLTRWSGITAEKLNDVTTTLSSVQAELRTLLSQEPTPILIGHSLESDLRALKLVHPRCVDTALTFHHPRGRPLKPGLAWLVKKWCDGRTVQDRGAGGHDPEEDARACVELVKRKCRSGPGFGEFKTDVESIFERLARGGGRGPGGGIRTAVVDRGNPGTWHGAGASTAIGCTSDTEALKGVLDVLSGHEFVWGRFTGVADALGWIQQKTTEGAAVDAPEKPSVEEALKTLNSHLAVLHAALPSRTALVLFTGHSDPRAMAELQARKSEFEAVLRAGGDGVGNAGGVGVEGVPREKWWTAADGRALEEAVERAKRGLLFLCLKE